MPRLTRFHSFLDRFEERLQVDCERLKRQLVDQVDMRFGDLRAKVVELRNGFGRGDRVGTSPDIDILFHDDPSVQNVSLAEWLNQQCTAAEEEKNRNEPSTSSGYKRKSSSRSQSGDSNKRQKTPSTGGSIKHNCKFTGCNKTFLLDKDLARHERIHLGIKPFFCTWPACRHSSDRKGSIVRHVRIKHFKLPALQKDQQRLNIVDNRNPEDYIRVDNLLLERRLV